MQDKHLIADLPQKALIALDGRVLLTRDIAAERWELPGGRLREDEQPIDGLHREVMEELGVRVEALGIFDTAVVIDRLHRAHYATVYLCRLLDDPASIILQADEVEEHRWVSPSDIAELPVVPGYKKVLEKYFWRDSCSGIEGLV